MTKAKQKNTSKPKAAATKRTTKVPFNPVLVELKSSNLAAAGYMDDTLIIKFNSGKVFAYSGVSKEKWADFLAAKSAGKYFAENIKGKYPEELIEFTGGIDEQTINGPATNDEPKGAELESAEGASDGGTADQPADEQKPDDAQSEPGDDVDSSDSEAGDDDTSDDDGTDVEGDENSPAPEPITGEPAKSPKPEYEPADPNAKIEILRQQLDSYGIDLQYEFAIDKAEVEHWNLTASVDRAGRTLHHTIRIDGNVTDDDVRDAHTAIVSLFVQS